MITVVKRRSWFDFVCDAVLLIFLSVVMGYGPDNHRMFIPAEILFVAVFGIRFFVKRSTVTNAFVSWSVLFFLLALFSGIYAYDKPFWFIRIKSVLQVLVFGNLVFPYIRESEESFNTFLYLYLLAILYVLCLLIVKTPFNVFFKHRLGVYIQINPNTIGYMFSIALLISLYLGFKWRWFYVLIPLFLTIAVLSGSKKVFILLGVGALSLVLLQQKSLKNSLITAGFFMIALVLGVLLISIIEPLRKIIGYRFFDMIATFQGNLDQGSTFIRWEMIKSGLTMFKQKPVLGWGLGAFDVYAGFDSYTHNNYIELLAALGIIGTFVYYSLFVSIVTIGIKKYFRFDQKGPYVLATSMVLAMLFDQMARVIFIEEYTNILIAFCYAGVVLDFPDDGLDAIQFIQKLWEYLTHPSRAGKHLLKMREARRFSDERWLTLYYRMSHGSRLNLDSPKTYSEKLQWQKLHDRNPLYPELVDKYAVRKYIAAKIGESHLVPLVDVYDDPADIVIEDLPNQCVIKPTHTSGDVLFCYDKTTFDWNRATALMKKWLSSNYYWNHREWPYKAIKPRIIIEELIKTTDGLPPRDYKIFCFDGEPKMAFVASDRPDSTKFDFFDVEWNRLPLKQHYPNSTYEIPKPPQWEEMLSIARTLSEGIPQVRVDLYIDADERILFGELTLSHFSGFEPFEPDSYDELIGSWVQLPIART